MMVMSTESFCCLGSTSKMQKAARVVKEAGWFEILLIGLLLFGSCVKASFERCFRGQSEKLWQLLLMVLFGVGAKAGDGTWQKPEEGRRANTTTTNNNNYYNYNNYYSCCCYYNNNYYSCCYCYCYIIDPSRISQLHLQPFF